MTFLTRRPRRSPTRTHRARYGAVTGALGAVVLVASSYLRWATGLGGAPGFVGAFRATVGEYGLLDHALGAYLLALAGAAWGGVYGALVVRPSPGKGVAFAALPAVWSWLVVAYWAGEPPLSGDPSDWTGVAGRFGLAASSSAAVWGAFLGWSVARWARPAPRDAP